MGFSWPVDMLIVGGGASGTLLVTQLLLLARGPLRIVWIDASGGFGRGLAYGRAEPGHLLNVPVERMSALPDDPGHFLRWCERSRVEVRPTDFLPRLLYGRYLEETLKTARRDAAAGVEVAEHQASLRRLRPAATGWIASRDDGEDIVARHVILACGNFASTPPAGVEEGTALLSPWDAPALDQIPPDGDVLLLGTGLTMVDAALSLQARGHRGRILALSRHGLLPRPHGGGRGAVSLELPRGASIRELTRAVRSAVDSRAPNSWRGVVDALRPHTAEIWQALPLPERRRFLRHLRAYWEVHRHRLPQQSFDAIAEMRRRGQLEIRSGRLLRLAAHDSAMELRWRQRGENRERARRLEAAINCTGPACSVAEVPLLRMLVEAGIARPDPAGLGLATHRGVVAGDARGTGQLLAIGPMRRGELFETTAIPEIRAQAQELAGRLLGIIAGDSVDAASGV